MINHTETIYKILSLDNHLYHVTALVSIHKDDHWGYGVDGKRHASRDIIDDIDIVECLDGHLKEVTDITIINRLIEGLK